MCCVCECYKKDESGAQFHIKLFAAVPAPLCFFGEEKYCDKIYWWLRKLNFNSVRL